MDKLARLSPTCVIAKRTQQRIPQFRGNPLIEALPPSMSDEELMEALLYRPEYDPEQRLWPTHERFQLLGSLTNFMVPLLRHVELARALDSMLRNGYVGRVPYTAEHTAIFQSIYEMQKDGRSFRQTANTRSPQLSTSLIGISGMGKTTTVTRWLAHVPKVIYHPELNIYQIPYLHLDMPNDGSSIKGLAHAILHQIDALIPGANYFEDFAGKGRTGADTLMRGVARVMHMHAVGLLICDEVQNLANSHKGAETVMTELVSACNELHVPILFIGTNKAAKVLSKDFRQARRSSGQGVSPWDRFPERVGPGEMNEWRDFLEILWSYQWTRKTTPLTDYLATTMYSCSQGVIDIAIKLFGSAQGRAIADGSEELTSELLIDVYQRELKLLHPMIEALRKNDIEALMNFDDIAPIGLDELLSGIERRVRAKSSPLYSVKPGDSTFVPRLSTALTAIGFDPEDAIAKAEDVDSSGRSTNLTQATKEALASVALPRRPPKSKKTTADSAQIVDFSGRPQDYRRAVQEARIAKTSTLEQLRAFGMASNLEDVLKLA